jgi:hypothetical protein
MSSTRRVRFTQQFPLHKPRLNISEPTRQNSRVIPNLTLPQSQKQLLFVTGPEFTKTRRQARAEARMWPYEYGSNYQQCPYVSYNRYKDGKCYNQYDLTSWIPARGPDAPRLLNRTQTRRREEFLQELEKSKIARQAQRDRKLVQERWARMTAQHLRYAEHLNSKRV